MEAINGVNEWQFPAFSHIFRRIFRIFRGPACGLGPAWPQGAGVHSGGPACALAGVCVHAGPLRTRWPPGGRRVLQARPGIASGVCWPDLASPPAARRPPEGKPRESRGKASGGACNEGERIRARGREAARFTFTVAAKRPASPHRREAARFTRPAFPSQRVFGATARVLDSTGFGALTANRVMDINGTIFGSKIGFSQS